MKMRNSVMVAAALAGLLGGTAARAAQTGFPQKTGLDSGSQLSAGLLADDNKKTKDIEKHACKGQNSCKGQGGGSKKEWGKNACKGHGACATDGSKPKG